MSDHQTPEPMAAPGAPMRPPEMSAPPPPPPPARIPDIIPFVLHEGPQGSYVERVGSPFMIPLHSSNSEYREYQAWVANGSPKV